MLREDQIQRYSRQILLREVGGAGQLRLLAARVRVTGAGRAADEAATYLAAAGVGTLCLDDDLAERVGAHLVAMNPDVTVVAAAPTDTAGAAAAIAPAPADDRLAGALAAHAVLAQLTGASPGFAWQLTPGALDPELPAAPGQ